MRNRKEKTTALLMAAMIAGAAANAQTVVNKQRHFKNSVPAGNYSGIAWLGADRYAVVDDKSKTAGFHLMTVSTDPATGDILSVKADSFVTCGQANRDEEGICYVPQSKTMFVSGEADGQIVEYTMDGRLTGRRLNIPEVYKTACSNGGFEALTYNAVTHRFWTTTEHTLQNDGRRPDLTHKLPNLLRLQSFSDDMQPVGQYWYMTDSTAVEDTEGRSILGVSGLAALDDGHLVVLEREVYQKPRQIGSFVNVKLYVTNPSRQQPGELLQKQLVTEFSTRINLTDRSFANYEGICVGPRLQDGRILLVMVADSQNQYKGYLKDWFRTVAMPVPDFHPQADWAQDIAALLKVVSTAERDTTLKAPPFLGPNELPDATRYIAEPPKPGDGAFANDTYYYHWGKQQRQTPQGIQAAIDEVMWAPRVFSPAAGFIISPKATPEIFKLAEGARADARTANRQSKNNFQRTRPYVHFGEPSVNPAADEAYRSSFSYPSGHSVRGWVYALTLALVVPDSTEALVARAKEYALNRVICGRHWKSDTDASLVEATAVMSRLLSNDAFLEQLEKARKEYARLRKNQ